VFINTKKEATAEKKMCARFYCKNGLFILFESMRKIMCIIHLMFICFVFEVTTDNGYCTNLANLISLRP